MKITRRSFLGRLALAAGGILAGVSIDKEVKQPVVSNEMGIGENTGIFYNGHVISSTISEPITVEPDFNFEYTFCIAESNVCNEFRFIGYTDEDGIVVEEHLRNLEDGI